jgi:succinate-semialdehyde dehydrogenase/glutarate-semialdehyde dehydrogenase
MPRLALRRRRAEPIQTTAGVVARGPIRPIIEQTRLIVPYPELRLFIGGRWKSSDIGEDVTNPADGTVLGRLPHASRADLDDALAAAQAGFLAWRNFTPAARERIILKAADYLAANAEDIAFGLVLDQGKTLEEARTEVRIAQDRIAWDATEGRRLYGRIIPAGPGFRKQVTRHPLGVVAAFTPWNYPLASPTRKVAGALAAGCSIILKGAEETPSGAVALVRAGCPTAWSIWCSASRRRFPPI